MSEFSISQCRDLDGAELVGLYSSVGWAAYAENPDQLVRAIAHSSFVVTARAPDGALIGLARVISDDVSICYLQDLLVSPDHRRAGVGRALMHSVLERYRHVRQKVLLTDAETGQRAFYESVGFTEAHDARPALRSFVQTGTPAVPGSPVRERQEDGR